MNQNSSQLTKEEVLKVAKLARINLTDKELDLFANQLASIVDYINKLRQLNTDDVEPTAHVLPLKNIFREDRAENRPKEAELALKAAPDRQDRFFRVPAILDGSSA